MQRFWDTEAPTTKTRSRIKGFLYEVGVKEWYWTARNLCRWQDITRTTLGVHVIMFLPSNKLHTTSSSFQYCHPPPSKNITDSFFVSGINFVGISRKIGNMVTNFNFWSINFQGMTGKFGRVSAQCEAVWTGDEQGLPEILVSWLPENSERTNPEGPTIKKIQSRSKFSISIEIFSLARKCQSRRLEIPTKNRAAVGGSLENFILARNFQSRSKSRFFFDLWALWEIGAITTKNR